MNRKLRAPRMLGLGAKQWQCLRLIFIWVTLITCFYVYGYHGDKTDTKRPFPNDFEKFGVSKLRSVDPWKGNSTKVYVESPQENEQDSSNEDKDHENDNSELEDGYAISKRITSKDYMKIDALNNSQDDGTVKDNILKDDALDQLETDLSTERDQVGVNKEDESNDIILLQKSSDKVHVINEDEEEEEKEDNKDESKEPIVESLRAAEAANVKDVDSGYIKNTSTKNNVKQVSADRVNGSVSKFSVKRNNSQPNGGIVMPASLTFQPLHWTIAEYGKYSTKVFTPPPNETPEPRLPQAIIIGVSGTQRLAEFMKLHPYIVTTESEVHFFDVDDNFRKGSIWYRFQMPMSFSNQVTVEKSTSYIWSRRALEEIHRMNSHMKLIVIVKDPVDRIIARATKDDVPGRSLNDFMVEDGGKLKVNTESRTVYGGMYATFLKQWFKKFPNNQIHIVEYRDFSRQTPKEMQKIEAFLGVPHMMKESNFYFNATEGGYCMRPFHTGEAVCMTTGKKVPRPALDPEVEAQLYNFYQRHNEDLFRLVGRRFEWGHPKQRETL